MGFAVAENGQGIAERVNTILAYPAWKFAGKRTNVEIILVCHNVCIIARHRKMRWLDTDVAYCKDIANQLEQKKNLLCANLSLIP